MSDLTDEENDLFLSMRTYFNNDRSSLIHFLHLIIPPYKGILSLSIDNHADISSDFPKCYKADPLHFLTSYPVLQVLTGYCLFEKMYNYLKKALDRVP